MTLPDVLTAVTVLALTGVAGWLGHLALKLIPDLIPSGDAARSPAAHFGRGYRSTLAVVTGLLLLHLLLLVLQRTGLPWTRLTVAVGLGSVLMALWVIRRVWPEIRTVSPAEMGDHSAESSQRLVPWAWREMVALLAGTSAVGAFAVATWTLRATHPDFVYHWGIKGHKFLLAGGVDFTYLARPWNHYVHPDYPRLLSELNAVAALPTGSFAERGQLVWSILALLGIAVALGQAARSARLTATTRSVVLAVTILGVGAFAIGHRLAGGADLPLALAVTLGLPPLLARRPTPGHDIALGLAAALAVATKMEGIPLAVSLMVLYWTHRWRCGESSPAPSSPPRPSLSSLLARTALPMALVALPWGLLNLRHGLFQDANSGPFEPRRWSVIVDALGDALAVPHWHGMAWILLAAPLLLVSRRSRLLGLLVVAQMAFYGWIYFTMVGDAGMLVRFSFPRLALPLVIPTALGLALVLDPPAPLRISPERRPPGR